MNKLGTGSNRELDAARMLNGCLGLFGAIGSFSDNFTAGHPIDAPEVLPAGACNSVEWRNAAGNAVVNQTEFKR